MTRLVSDVPAAATNTTRRIALVRPPAKLNLFLELVARRNDGYHDLDTVMVPIDWSDEMRLRRSSEPGVRLRVDWLPSTPVIAQRCQRASSELLIPDDANNLVHRALTRVIETFVLTGGFECELYKRIPAGAGMGGASSDAAAALDAALKLCGVTPEAGQLESLAAELGSDVPFFLGHRVFLRHQGTPVRAARAQGRGEILTPVSIAAPLDFVVVFPGESLSTPTVYAASKVPAKPSSAEGLIDAMHDGNRHRIAAQLMNRLSDPAREIEPRIDEILKSMWRAGLRTCQLTGSGSACFAIASNTRHAKSAAARLRAMLQPGAIVMATRTTSVPPLVKFESQG